MTGGRFTISLLLVALLGAGVARSGGIDPEAAQLLNLTNAVLAAREEKLKESQKEDGLRADAEAGGNQPVAEGHKKKSEELKDQADQLAQAARNGAKGMEDALKRMEQGAPRTVKQALDNQRSMQETQSALDRAMEQGPYAQRDRLVGDLVRHKNALEDQYYNDVRSRLIVNEGIPNSTTPLPKTAAGALPSSSASGGLAGASGGGSGGSGGSGGGGGGGGGIADALMGVAAIAAGVAPIVAAGIQANADKEIAQTNAKTTIQSAELQSETSRTLADTQKQVALAQAAISQESAQQNNQGQTDRLQLQLDEFERARDQREATEVERRTIEQDYNRTRIALAQEQARASETLARQTLSGQLFQAGLTTGRPPARTNSLTVTRRLPARASARERLLASLQLGRPSKK